MCKRSRLENGLKNLLEVIFQVSNHKEVDRAKINKQSNNRCNSRGRNTCHGRSRGEIVATLVGVSASKLIFIVIRILTRTAISGRLSH